jgi:lysophospholipase L1-like esterase
LIGGVLLAVGLAGAMLGRSQREWTYQGAAGKGAAKATAAGLNWRQLGLAGAGVLASCAVLMTPVKTRLIYHASPQVASVMKSLRTSRLNVRDAAILEHGYYEDLTHAERFNPQLFELYSKMPAGMDVRIKGEGIRPTQDFRRRELVPARSAVFSNGIELKVNAHGLRDREYGLQKPAGTLRIAVVGASEVMGWGVENHETFENLLEDWLNTHNTTDRYSRYEVMNFAVSGYGAIEKLIVLEQRVLEFDPDVLFYMANKKEYQLVIDRIVEAVRGGVGLPYDFLETITAEEGIDRGTHEVLAKGRLRPRAPEMLGLVYNRVAGLCRDRGIQPVWVYVPQPGAEPPNRRDINKFFGHAEEAGFDIVDLSDAFAGASAGELRMAEWDSHPNVAGHRALAECLKRKLQEHPRLSHLLLGDGAPIDRVGQAFKEPSRVQTKE